MVPQRVLVQRSGHGSVDQLVIDNEHSTSITFAAAAMQVEGQTSGTSSAYRSVDRGCDLHVVAREAQTARPLSCAHLDRHVCYPPVGDLKNVRPMRVTKAMIEAAQRGEFDFYQRGRRLGLAPFVPTPPEIVRAMLEAALAMIEGQIRPKEARPTPLPAGERPKLTIVTARKPTRR
jgi:hypothetical protein